MYHSYLTSSLRNSLFTLLVVDPIRQIDCQQQDLESTCLLLHFQHGKFQDIRQQVTITIINNTHFYAHTQTHTKLTTVASLTISISTCLSFRGIGCWQPLSVQSVHVEHLWQGTQGWSTSSTAHVCTIQYCTFLPCRMYCIYQMAWTNKHHPSPFAVDQNYICPACWQSLVHSITHISALLSIPIVLFHFDKIPHTIRYIGYMWTSLFTCA